MTTKEKILNVSLELFNEKGVREVSTRMISEAAEISQGNLTYHFAKKDDIILEVYLMLVRELDQVFEASSQQQQITVAHLFDGTRFIYSIMMKYRFCLIDFVQLMRDVPKIKEHFKSLMEFRQGQFKAMFMNCISSGIIKEEEFEGQYAKMSTPLGVFGDYWISHSEVLFSGTEPEAVDHYARSAMMMLYPIMTDRAKKECIQFL